MVKEGRIRRNYELNEDSKFLKDLAQLIIYANYIVGKRNHKKLRRQLHQCIDLLLDNRGKKFTILCQATGIETTFYFTNQSGELKVEECPLGYLKDWLKI